MLSYQTKIEKLKYYTQKETLPLSYIKGMWQAFFRDENNKFDWAIGAKYPEIEQKINASTSQDLLKLIEKILKLKITGIKILFEDHPPNILQIGRISRLQTTGVYGDELFINFAKGKILAYESSISFPRSGQKIEDEEIEIKIGEIYGFNNFILIIEDMSSSQIELRAYEFSRKNQSDIPTDFEEDCIEDKYKINALYNGGIFTEFPLKIGRGQTINISKDTCEREYLQVIHRESKFYLQNVSKSQELVKMFHTSLTYKQSPSPLVDITNQSFWYEGKIFKADWNYNFDFS